MAIRIAHIITDLHTGGAETMLLKLMSRTDFSRFRPVVISLMEGGSIQACIKALGVPVRSLGMTVSPDVPLRVWQLVRTLREVEPELVQGWMVHGNLAASMAATFLPRRIPVLWNIRHSAGDLTSEKRRTIGLIRLMARLSGRPARVLYNSRESISEHEAIGYARNNAVFLPNGFDCEMFRPDTAARLSVRKELGLPTETVLIGLSARYHPMKGHQYFCTAAAAVDRADVHFILMGRGVDSTNSELTGLVSGLGVSDKFHMLGERADMPRLTAALDIATSASVGVEGFSNAVGEAMACAVPCVVTDVGASAWIVGETGRVVQPRNSLELVTAWDELLDMGRYGRGQLGEAARTRVLAEFSIDRVTAEYEQLYLQILSS